MEEDNYTVDEFGFPCDDNYLNQVKRNKSTTHKIPPSLAPIVAGVYRNKNGYSKKEYFFKDRINDGEGGLQVDDIALAYTHRSERCVPVKITRINVPIEEVQEANVNINDMVYINFKTGDLGDSLYGRI